ncbi:MAG: hypothetical protein ACWA5L_09595 [bacterium]
MNIILGFVAFVFLGAGAAQNGSIYDCATITENGARLACYDSFARGKEAAQLRAQDQAPTGEQQAAPSGLQKLNPLRNFGLPEHKRDDQGPSQITAKVSEIRVNHLGQITLKLDNGQVWRQTGSDVRFMKNADPQNWTVTIKKGALGSFWMKIPESRKRKFKVQRVI